MHLELHIDHKNSMGQSPHYVVLMIKRKKKHEKLVTEYFLCIFSGKRKHFDQMENKLS